MSDTKTPIATEMRHAYENTNGVFSLLRWRDDVLACLAQHERDLAAALVRAQKAEAALLCPGQMRCAKCKFELTRRTMYVQSGTIGAGTSETEPCPNGCGPLWPVTWEQEARSCYASLDRLFDEKQKAESDLAALRAENERLRKDAERYRLARRKIAIIASDFHVVNLRPRYVAPDAAIEFDAAIDEAMAEKEPT